MSFLIDKFSTWSHQEAEACFRAYADYLESVKNALPASAFAFATAAWHYQNNDHRCPHDAWVDQLRIWESASGDRKQDRQIQIDLRLFGAFHDGYLDLSYKNVSSYRLDGHPRGDSRRLAHIGHGDWLIDEIRLSDSGFVLHEILFSSRGRWLIEASDISCEWKPFEIGVGSVRK